MRTVTRSLFRNGYLVFVLAVCGTSVMGQAAPAKPLPKQISGGILNGKATSLPKPDYPASARAEKASGKVGVQVLIDEGGNVVSAKAVSGPENADLRLAAETAAMAAMFSPTTLSGNPVKVSGVITYDFVLSEDHVEVMGPFMASTVLYMIKDFASDSERFRRALDMDDGELRSILKDAATDPEFPGLEPLATLESTPAGKRGEVIENALASIQSKLDADGKWKFALGKAFSEAIGSLMLLAIEPNPDPSRIDQVRVRAGLKEMKRMLATAPTDIPKSVLDDLNRFAAMADREDLFSETGMEAFAKSVGAIFMTISPDIK